MNTDDGYFFLDDIDPEGGFSFTPVDKKKTCLECDRELSAYLDAYYGKDAYAKEFCASCRSKLDI